MLSCTVKIVRLDKFSRKKDVIELRNFARLYTYNYQHGIGRTPNVGEFIWKYKIKDKSSNEHSIFLYI